MADLHLGYRRYNKITPAGFNQREVDVSQAFREAVTRAAALKPDITVIAGDVFHSVRPSNAVLTFCFREMRRLVEESGAPVVISAGNHESPKRADSGNALRLLSEIKGVYVADSKESVFRFPEIQVAVTCLPHVSLLQSGPNRVRADDRFKFNVLVVHAQLDDRWVSDFGGAQVNIRDLSPHEWDYVALGHVHFMKEVALNAAYSGALEHTSLNFWAEGSLEKGFLEVELPSQKRLFHGLTSPREVLVLEAVEASGASVEQVMQMLSDRLESVPGGIEGKLLRLEIRDIPHEVQRQLDWKRIRGWRALALNLTLDMRVPRDHQVLRSFKTSSGMQLERELEQFCAARNFHGVKNQAVVELLREYLKELEKQQEAGQG
ncbi:MAG: DNA repair exonuclease [Bdellovibrionales bacterium]|nr:DNA repair exonuclease [Bdellovibrionales bacterium]